MGKKIMLVDDAAFMRMTIKNYLTTGNAGHYIVHREGSTQAARPPSRQAPSPYSLGQDFLNRLHNTVSLKGLDDKVLRAGAHSVHNHGLLAHGRAHHHISVAVLRAEAQSGYYTEEIIPLAGFTASPNRSILS